jgi:LuxR family maltose regulon positive regulatory protein
LAFLLDHLPPHLHIIIATRVDPPLPLARLRARSQLVEVRAADLRFTPEEATIFLNQVMNLNLSVGDIAALEAHTEGWIAGLQLAALAMQGRKDVSSFVAVFTGSHRYILDYLVEEVLRRQPQDIQDFMVQTSILDRLCGPLCDAVTGRAELVVLHARGIVGKIGDGLAGLFATRCQLLTRLDDGCDTACPQVSCDPF